MSGTDTLFTKKMIQYERAVLDAIDIPSQVFYQSQSLGDGFVRHLASVKTLQLDLLRLYLAGIKKMDIPEEDKETLKRFVMRLQENFNQCLSVALAGAFRMAADTKGEELYDGIRHVSYLQEHLDKMMLELAKYRASIISKPDELTKLTPLLRQANCVLGYYPETLGYLASIQSPQSMRTEGKALLSEEAQQYVNRRDSAKEIINSLKGMYSEKGIDELIERVEKDVDWYVKVHDFMPSDGEINEVVE